MPRPGCGAGRGRSTADSGAPRVLTSIPNRQLDGWPRGRIGLVGDHTYLSGGAELYLGGASWRRYSRARPRHGGLGPPEDGG